MCRSNELAHSQNRKHKVPENLANLKIKFVKTMDTKWANKMYNLMYKEKIDIFYGRYNIFMSFNKFQSCFQIYFV